MFDARTNLSADVAAEVRRHLGAAVFDTIVPRSVRLSEAPSFGLPIALHRPDSRGAEAYAALATELLGRNPPRRQARRRRRPPQSRRSRKRRPNPSRWGAPEHDSPTRSPAGSRARPRRAHPAARPRHGKHGDRDLARSPEPPSATPANGPGRVGGSRGEHPRTRRAPAHPRDRDARRLSARGRRAAVPGQPDRRPRTNPRAHPPTRRSRAARDRPRREPPARRISGRWRRPTRSARSSTTSACPRTTSRRASGGLDRPSRTRSACSTSIRGPIGRCREHDHGGARKGHRRAARRAAGSRCRHSRGAAILGSSDRGARPPAPNPAAGTRDSGAQPGRTQISSASRRNCVAPWARR